MTLQEILSTGDVEQIIAFLSQKTIEVPPWESLKKEYDPSLHPVMCKASYPDVRRKDGTIEHVTRITYALQQLAVKRMTELCTGIPVKRIYSPTNDRQAEVAKYLENIFLRNRINSVNVERLNMLFASCEVMTLWYAVEQPNNKYGFESKLKLRCKNFSPMDGAELYPLFDEYGDMVACSIKYATKIGQQTVNFYDVYMPERHIKLSDVAGEWAQVQDEQISLLKIPAIYMYRPTPIWERESSTVSEIEWSLSRNGNYLRKNSKPVFAIFADDKDIEYGKEQSESKEFRSILQYPQNAKAEYITWNQATEALKFHVSELRNAFFTQLQLPDWSYEKMSQQALSGESRKQLFIDAQMKVKDESGRLLEFFDREVNVVKEFLKVMLPDGYAADIDALQVECEITPFSINDDKDTISNLLLANGNKPLMSQRESIEYLGWSADVDKTMQEISDGSKADAFELTE